MIICLFSIAFLNQIGSSYGIITMIVLYIVAYQGSIGGITFVHALETCPISIMGTVTLSLFFWNVVTCFLGSYIIEKYGASSIFIFFGTVSTLGLAYI
jgi:hypothetical protein